MTRIYIAGPCTGLPDNGYPAFNDAAAKLRALGYSVINPAENSPPPCGSWLGYMRMSVAQVAQVDTVVLLPGWIHSKGARIEMDLAVKLGLQVRALAEVVG